MTSSGQFGTLISHLDTLITLQINHPAGRSALLDKLVFDISDSTFVKGGIFLAAYWWFWFDARRADRSSQRRDVIVALIGCVLVAIVARALQVGLPFHHRPLHTPDLGVRLPLSVDPETLNTFSSFPSDHAMLFFALCVPLWSRSRLLGLAAGLWTMFVICLPRIYLGYHWASDTLAGAFIGVILMLVLRPILLATPLPDRALRLESEHPAVFYAVSWLLVLELAVLFYDIRHFMLDAANLTKMLMA